MTNQSSLPDLVESINIGQTNVTDIPEDHPFWGVLYHAMMKDFSSQYKFAYTNRNEYGKGVNPEAFAKLIDALSGGQHPEEIMAQAVDRFSAACTQEEWENLYGPILRNEKVLHGVSPFMWNKACPISLQVPTPKIDELTTFNPKTTKIPDEFMIEPYSDHYRRYIWYISEREIVCYEVDQLKEITNHPDMIDAFKRFQSPGMVTLTIDSFYDTEVGSWVLRDIYVDNQLKPSDIKTRIGMLESIRDQVLQDFGFIEIPECITSTLKDNQTNRTEFSLVIEQGYPGAIFRDITSRYEGNAGILVMPDRTSNITCTGAEKTEDGTVYLTGDGKVGRKKFTVRVHHGLTSEDREQLYEQRENLVGKRFKIVSCGLGNNDIVAFPVFKEWIGDEQ